MGTQVKLQNIMKIWILVFPAVLGAYINPVIDLNLPDPGILALREGGYAVVATSDHATDSLTESAFPLHGSDDLVNWEPKGFVFPPGSWPNWQITTCGLLRSTLSQGAIWSIFQPLQP